MKKVLTLALVQKNNELLLGFKKRGFGAGKWNGFGGKVEPGETIADAARRELAEEVGLTAHALTACGLITFTFADDAMPCEIHFFRVTDFSGTPQESDEMKPQWFPVNEIPYHAMWADDVHWMPYFLRGKKFVGRCHYAGDLATILAHEIRTVTEV